MLEQTKYVLFKLIEINEVLGTFWQQLLVVFSSLIKELFNKPVNLDVRNFPGLISHLRYLLVLDFTKLC